MIAVYTSSSIFQVCIRTVRSNPIHLTRFRGEAATATLPSQPADFTSDIRLSLLFPPFSTDQSKESAIAFNLQSHPMEQH